MGQGTICVHGGKGRSLHGLRMPISRVGDNWQIGFPVLTLHLSQLVPPSVVSSGGPARPYRFHQS
jgi:hypothetical protein